MNSLSRCKPLLGTYVEVNITADVTDDVLIEMSNKAYAAIQRIEKLMSFHDADSELTHINLNAHLNPCKISGDMEAVLRQALEISALTDGIFDISIAPELVKRGHLPCIKNNVEPSACWQDITLQAGEVSFEKNMLIDLGGIAKGYAVDQAISLFDDDVDVTVNAGGDLRMNHWQGKEVFIKSPGEDKKTLVALQMQADALATSAAYYLDGSSVIITPASGLPVMENSSFSVFADSCMLADGLTKVAYLLRGYHVLFDSINATLVVIDETGRLS